MGLFCIFFYMFLNKAMEVDIVIEIHLRKFIRNAHTLRFNPPLPALTLKTHEIFLLFNLFSNAITMTPFQATLTKDPIDLLIIILTTMALNYGRRVFFTVKSIGFNILLMFVMIQFLF